MKRGFVFFVLFAGMTVGFTQNVQHKSTVDTFISDYNKGDFEKIYQSFSEKMQKARTKKYYFAFFSKIKKDHGNILSLNLQRYRESNQKNSQATYDGNFRNGTLTVRISVNSNGKIFGLHIIKDKAIL